jgi:Fe-S oxidoreductase
VEFWSIIRIFERQRLVPNSRFVNGLSSTAPDRHLRVGLFVTCLVDPRRPRIGFAALPADEAAGCEVVVPTTQACCGQPNYNSGECAGAQRLAFKMIEAFAPCDYVVAPSDSRAGMVCTHYPELFSDRPDEVERVRQLAARTYELTDSCRRPRDTRFVNFMQGGNDEQTCRSRCR